jgi:hypothetical protein
LRASGAKSREVSPSAGRLPTRAIYYDTSETDPLIARPSNQELTTMTLKRSHRQTARRLEFLDTLMDSYMNWRDHSRAVDESFRRWTDSTCGDRRMAYGQYLTALDREERAAHGYKRTLEQTQAT